MWKLYYHDNPSYDESQYVSSLLAYNLNSIHSCFNTSLDIFCPLDVEEYKIHDNSKYMSIMYADGFVGQYVSVSNLAFDDLYDGVLIEKQFLKDSEWKSHTPLNRLVDDILSLCNNWTDITSFPKNFIGEFYVWYLKHYFGNIMFLTPYLHKTDDESFLIGFKLASKVCEILNNSYDYSPYDFDSMNIRYFK